MQTKTFQPQVFSGKVRHFRNRIRRMVDFPISHIMGAQWQDYKLRAIRSGLKDPRLTRN